MTRPTITLRGGTFSMGSDDFYPDEGPVVEVDVDPFAIDAYLVTNADFARFVGSTGYVTTAERPLEGESYSDLADEARAPGSVVFTGTAGPVALDDWRRWWAWVPGASWRSPRGPGSGIDDTPNHPVVQVSYEDACAFARWSDAWLPSERQWEFAARGGVDGTVFAWGDEERPEGRLMANTWQGCFPYRNLGAAGWPGTSPVGAFPPNRNGIFDMIGNVWEWTEDVYAAVRPTTKRCCGPRHADLATAVKPTSDKVLKGGSHLCAPEYCFRYRPAARSRQAPDSATSHIGFRCIRSEPPQDVV